MTNYNVPTQEELAQRICAAIVKLANNPDGLDNFKNYLRHHFGAWFDRICKTPEDLTTEIEEFANIEYLPF